MLRWGLSLILLSLAATSFAQVPAPPAPPIAAQAPDYSQQSYVIEKLRTSYRFENDGKGRREVYALIKIQSEAGVEQWGQLVVGYNSANERLEIPFVRVRKADGSTVAASSDRIQDLSIPLEKEAPVYTDFRQKHVTVPGLRPGEELEYEWVAVTHTALAPGQFWMEHNFLTSGTVLEEQLELDIPKERAIKLKTKPGADPKIHEAEGRRIYTWTTSHVDKNGEENEKGKHKKGAKEPEAPAVQMTTFDSWEQVGRWYGALEQDRQQPTPEIRARATALIQGKTDDLDKIQALYDYVATGFRYISLSFGIGRFQPHAAAEVLTNEYGDCKDKHTLLAALLEASGYHASAVLINSARKLDPDLPSPSQFDHMFTMVPLGKEEIWMDSTTEVAPFRLLASVLRKKQALVIPQDGVPHLETTPADPPMMNRQFSQIDARINELGKLDAHVSYEFRGDTELYMRTLFRRIPRNKWNEFLKQMNALSGLAGEVSEISATDPARTHEPFKLEYRIAVASFLDWSKKKTDLLLPLSQINMNDRDDDDSEPVEIGSPVEYVYRLRLEFPRNYRERSPLPFAMKRDYGRYEARYQVDGNVFTADRTLTTTIHELPAARSSDYIAFRRAVLADAEQHLSIDSSAAAPPALAELRGDELYDAAKAAFERGNYATSIDLFQKVVAADPRHKTAWTDLGRAYMLMRQTDKAVEAFQKQCALNPYDEYAFSSLGWAYTTERKYDEAATAFSKAIEINPLSEYAHAALGAMYQESHQYQKAVPELEKAVSLKSDDAALEISLGDAYLNLGQDQKALEAFDRATEISATPEVWNNIAYQLSLKRTHLERAQQYAESAVTAVANSLRNLSLERLSDRDLANTTQLDANWDTLGWVYFARGDLGKAQKYVSAAWVLGQHGEVGDHLAQIYEKLGDRSEAIRIYAMSLSGIRPSNETRLRLAALLGGNAKISSEVEHERQELQALRTIKLGKIAPLPGTADFFVLITPAAEGARIEAAKFVAGEEKLKPLAENLRSAKIDFAFPDDVPTKILRRGVLSCSASRECDFVMILPEDVHSVD
jgi:tetratricopeptide (TPR) repeat protein